MLKFFNLFRIFLVTGLTFFPNLVSANENTLGRKFLNPLAEAIIQTIPKEPVPQAQASHSPVTIEKIFPLMRVPAKHLNFLDKYGFLNQHQTGTSLGLLHPLRRLREEVRHFNLFELSNDLPRALFPKYGYLDFKTLTPSGIHMKDDTARYGNVIFVFKPETQARMSYSVSDSSGMGSDKSLFPHAEITPFQLKDASIVSHFKQYVANFGSTSYIEFQCLGDLGLQDVQEIWIPEDPVTRHGKLDEEAKTTLRDFSTKFQIPIYQAVPGKQKDDFLLYSRTLDLDLTSERVQASLRSHSPTAHLPEPSQSATPDDLNKEHLLTQWSSASPLEKKLMISKLVDHGIYQGLPAEIETLVREEATQTRSNLLQLALGHLPAQVRARALTPVLSHPWPNQILDPKVIHEITQTLGNRELLQELTKGDPTHEHLITLLKNTSSLPEAQLRELLSHASPTPLTLEQIEARIDPIIRQFEYPKYIIPALKRLFAGLPASEKVALILRYYTKLPVKELNQHDFHDLFTFTDSDQTLIRQLAEELPKQIQASNDSDYGKDMLNSELLSGLRDYLSSVQLKSPREAHDSVDYFLRHFETDQYLAVDISSGLLGNPSLDSIAKVELFDRLSAIMISDFNESFSEWRRQALPLLIAGPQNDPIKIFKSAPFSLDELNTIRLLLDPSRHNRVDNETITILKKSAGHLSIENRFEILDQLARYHNGIASTPVIQGAVESFFLLSLKDRKEILLELKEKLKASEPFREFYVQITKKYLKEDEGRSDTKKLSPEDRRALETLLYPTSSKIDEGGCTGSGSGSIAPQADQLSKTLPSLLERASM